MNPVPEARVLSNIGLMDQIAALQWIKENIKQFYGDSNQVTLMGSGIGAANVNFLMLSPAVPPGEKKNLFKREQN